LAPAIAVDRYQRHREYFLTHRSQLMAIIARPFAG
jgi:hypothetical protein